jgi:hypothetical protein
VRNVEAAKQAVVKQLEYLGFFAASAVDKIQGDLLHVAGAMWPAGERQFHELQSTDR